MARKKTKEKNNSYTSTYIDKKKDQQAEITC